MSPPSIDLERLVHNVDQLGELYLDAEVAGDVAMADVLAEHGGRLGLLHQALRLLMPSWYGHMKLVDVLKIVEPWKAEKAVELLHWGGWIDDDTYAQLRSSHGSG